jgi:hypothetical protein
LSLMQPTFWFLIVSSPPPRLEALLAPEHRADGRMVVKPGRGDGCIHVCGAFEARDVCESGS